MLHDAAWRLIAIHHRDPVSDTIFELEYAYLDNNLVSQITESDAAGWVATVDFMYDTRGRLISEVRSDLDVAKSYDFAYDYDQGGNRTLKAQTLADGTRIDTRYTYDIEDPVTYGSNNNRLMTYEVCRVSSGSSGPPSRHGDPGFIGDDDEPEGGDPPSVVTCDGGGELLSSTWYFYTPAGNVERCVTNQAGTDVYTATQMAYGANAQVMTFVAGESWTWDGDPASDPQDYLVSYVREFRYDGARQRYLSRELTPPPPGQNGFDYTVISDIWSDYDGNRIYGDYEVTVASGWPPPEPEVTELRSFEPGIGRMDPWDVWGQPDYYHSDMIGTTRFMTDAGGNQVDQAVYTAFGERISGTMDDLGDRYGYAGAWGYQAHEDFPYLHVGHRYYDPATGRFLQRDPIGIVGGINVYGYAGSAPQTEIDPSGFGFLSGAARWGPIGVCGWLAVEFTDRVVKPWLDEWIEENYEEEMDRINDPPPPPPWPPREYECHADGSCDEANDPPVGPRG